MTEMGEAADVAANGALAVALAAQRYDVLWCLGTTENTIFYGKSKCARQPYKPSLCQAQTGSTTEPCIIEGRAIKRVFCLADAAHGGRAVSCPYPATGRQKIPLD